MTLKTWNDMYETKLLVVTIKLTGDDSVVILAKPRARSIERQLTPINTIQFIAGNGPISIKAWQAEKLQLSALIVALYDIT